MRDVRVVGCHAEGEVGDVIVGGVPTPEGATMFERMQSLARDDDALRRFLLCEPRGSVARHVNLLTPPTRADCDAGLIIMEPTEYPPMSGSNLICAVTVLLETGIVAMVEPETRLAIDTPAGRVPVRAACVGGKCVSVTFESVPSLVLLRDAVLEVAGFGRLRCDVAFGGMIYAIVDAADFGFSIVPAEARALAAAGEAIRAAARAQLSVVHPENPAIAGVSIVQLAGPFAGPGRVSRNTCIVAPGRSDRSPTGTGTCARMALLHARGLLGVGETFIHQSIIGSSFAGRLLRETTVSGQAAIVPEITGRGWITGHHRYVLDAADPYPEGYRVADTWPGSLSQD